MSLARKKFLRARRALHNPCSRSNKQSLQHSIGESYQTVTLVFRVLLPNSSSKALRDTSLSSLGPLATRNTRSENNPPQAEWRIRPPILEPDSFDTLSCKRQGFLLDTFFLGNDVTKA